MRSPIHLVDFEVFLQDGHGENRVVAEGYTVHCALDDAFRPMPVPEEFRWVVEEFEGRL